MKIFDKESWESKVTDIDWLKKRYYFYQFTITIGFILSCLYIILCLISIIIIKKDSKSSLSWSWLITSRPFVLHLIFRATHAIFVILWKRMIQGCSKSRKICGKCCMRCMSRSRDIFSKCKDIRCECKCEPCNCFNVLRRKLCDNN